MVSKKTNQLNQLTSYSIENDILNNIINFLHKKSKINNINENKAENKIVCANNGNKLKNMR